MEKTEKIDEIIEIEWNMFQDVQNIGGRASCQDDKETFVITCTSQFENWTEALLDAYLSYIENAECEGRNLIAEKYGRMMKYTEPHYYEEQIKPYIPALSAHAEQMIEEVIAIIVPWEAEFAKCYPKLGRVSRPVTAEGDTSGFTSMETYARGELGTYSEELLAMYLDYMRCSKKTRLAFLFCFSYRRKQNAAEHEHCANQSLKIQNLMQENEGKSGRAYRLQREFRQVRLLSLHKITFDLCQQLIQHLAAGAALVSDIRDFAERL